MYKLKIDKPSLVPGTEVEIPGLGVFENGKEYVIEDDAAEAYRAAHPVFVKDVRSEDGSIVSAEFELGPTLLQAFKDDDTIVITTVKKPAADKVEGEVK